MKHTLAFLAAFLLATLPAAEPMTNSIGMKLVPIAPGSFVMGQDGPGADYKMNKHPEKFDDADWDEKPAHRVTITQPFHMGATEVTLGQWRLFQPEFRRNNGADDEAVRGVSWNDAMAFCAWLSSKEGKAYRLPTEAEWEYACRAGTTTLFHTGDALPVGFQKWFRDENRRSLYFTGATMPPEYRQIPGIPTVQVAQTTPNAWGLHDMHGNVAEWCADWYGPYEAGEQTDPLGRSDGDFRVFRSGTHSRFSRMLRSANRGAWLPESQDINIGFRVVLGALPKGTLLSPPAPQLHAQNVSQALAKPQMPAAEVPFFDGPKVFVKIPPDSIGPLYSWHNHSPTITECPNGDLLAAWFSCVDEGGSELNNLAARLRFGASEWELASPFWDGADVNDHAPKLWWDGDNTIFHFARGLSENIVRTSTDNGATWSKARTVYPPGEFGNQLLRTREGGLYLTHDSRTTGLVSSQDGGKTWSAIVMKERDPVEVIRPGGTGHRPPGIHAPIVQLTDGRLMAISRQDPVEDQARFHGRTPVSISRDQGQTWTFSESEFPAISSAQRAVLFRLKEGPLLLCSFTDQGRNWKNRKGLTFKAADGSEFTGYGLFAVVSFDDGKTWPSRRLITPGGEKRELPTIDRGIATFSDTMAESTGYLAITQIRDGRIQLLSSKNHYVFNLAWLKALPPAPVK
ncbi:MAG: SUMF1/EgtB/PvdO family nonheme iron enzyme [Roseimicrobium sp.]